MYLEKRYISLNYYYYCYYYMFMHKAEIVVIYSMVNGGKANFSRSKATKISHATSPT